MYVVFARKYRPERFEDVIGQQHITRTLQNAVRTGRIAHAYLFCGSRGIGKTTVARILAKALNCKDGPTPRPCCECESCRRIARGDDMDVLEIDGASNRGIDEVRDLRQNVSLAPAHSRYKVYYIDEVHMLTPQAFNALLKTLEEPPEHVKFIFSTTDPQDMPETVKSRCQRFDFRRVQDGEIVDYLKHIGEEEELEVEDGGLELIARAARGGIRDALGVLDQLAAFGDSVTLDDVHSVLGTVDRSSLTELVDAVAEEDTASALEVTDRLLFKGTDVEVLADQLTQHLRDVLVAAYCEPGASMLAGVAADAETLQRQSGLFSPEQLTYMIQILREAKLRARRDTTGRIALELAVIKMSRLSDLVPVAETLENLETEGEPARRPTAGPDSPGPREKAPSAGDAEAGAGALRRMKERLAGRGEASTGGRDEQEPTGEAPPGGIDDTKYRQLLNSADDPEAAREALKDKPLLEAFVEADKAIGLNPLRVERRQPAEPEADAEPEEIEDE